MDNVKKKKKKGTLIHRPAKVKQKLVGNDIKENCYLLAACWKLLDNIGLIVNTR